MLVVPYREENIVRKGENAGYPYFLLFPECWLKVRVKQLWIKAVHQFLRLMFNPLLYNPGF